MLIYGGINGKDVYLNDLWGLSVLNHKWKKIEISKNRDVKNYGVAYHTMCVCYDKTSLDFLK